MKKEQKDKQPFFYDEEGEQETSNQITNAYQSGVVEQSSNMNRSDNRK
ncbi:hypothetical protein [Bacillus solimangrovi]|nr:hypothetical protein [Bacillus solimangrovi]